MLTVQTPSTSFTLPTTWGEVTLSQYIQLRNRSKALRDRLTEGGKTDEETDIVNQTLQAIPLVRSILEILTSDIASLVNIDAAEEGQIMNRLTFLAKVPDFRALPVPSRIADVKPPTELGACTLLQKWSVDETIEELADEGEEINYITMAIPSLSIYLYPLLTNSQLTDTSQIDQVRTQIEALPVTEALPLANFFLSNYQSSTSSGQTTYAISYPNQPLKDWRSHWFPNWKPIKSMVWLRRLLRTAA